MKWVVPALLMLVALAGCFGGTDGDDVDGGDVEQAPVDSDSGNETNSPSVDGDSGDVTNSPPVIEFGANQTEGPAPLDVRFDFNASDADGDEISWTLDVDGDGTAESEGALLPFNFTYTYSSPGTFNATLNVTDGTAHVVEVRRIVVTEPDEGDSDDGEDGDDGDGVPEPVIITGTALVPNPVIGSQLFCLQDGIDGDIYDIAPAEPGWSYTLEDPLMWTVYWWSGGSYMSTGSDEGVVPDGADQAEVCSDAAAGGVFEFTLTLTHPSWQG